MIKFLKSLLSSSTDTLSSKRFCGLLGWLVLLGCLGYASWAATELPGCTPEFIFGTVTLLGVDSVTSIWKSSKESGSTPLDPSGRKRGKGGKRSPRKETSEIFPQEEYSEFPESDPGLIDNTGI